MLPATEEEENHVRDYMEGQASDLTVTFIQKVYEENIINHIHAVWDVHTNKDRWWVMTNPMNLYSQEQFPNMDYAVTFHVGLCIRIPRSEKQKATDLPVEPFAMVYKELSDAQDSLLIAKNVADYKAIGVKCRETLVAFADVAQNVLPWTSTEEKPKRADFKAWVDHICTVILQGPSHEHRRHLFKSMLDSAWKFDNWLTHSKSSHIRDAECAIEVTGMATQLCMSAIIHHVRGVPDECPQCGSQNLSPERGTNTSMPGRLFERPTCDDCDWVGETVEIKEDPEEERKPSEGKCIVPNVPLRKLKRPGDDSDTL
jgi:hypothetical protein